MVFANGVDHLRRAVDALRNDPEGVHDTLTAFQRLQDLSKKLQERTVLLISVRNVSAVKKAEEDFLSICQMVTTIYMFRVMSLEQP